MAEYTREQLVCLAKCCEQTERYDEMKEAMKKVVGFTAVKLNPEERNLLSVAYKNVVGSRRSAWRALHSLTMKDDYDETVVSNLKTKVLEELKVYSKEVIDLLDNSILENKLYENEDNQVFYYKMKGDYLRYVAEVVVDDKDERKKYTDSSSAAYTKAVEVAKQHLPITSSVYLGLILNFSVFYYEIAGLKDKATKLAENAFDEAMAKMESNDFDASEVKDSTLILQLLRDNLTLWKADEIEETEDLQ